MCFKNDKDLHDEQVIMDKGNKILIIQTAFIGDVILTTPLIELLAKEYPNAKIDFLTTPKSENLLESNPNITNLILFDKKGKDRGLRGLTRLGKMLKNNQYDLCLTPHRSLRSAYLTWMTRAAMRIGFNRSACKKAYTHVVKYERVHHEIERNLSLLAPVGLNKQKIFPVIYSTREDKEKVKKLLNKLNMPNTMRFFAVAPGSVWPTKRWPEKYYKNFCQLLEEKGNMVILIGGTEDENLCNRIAGQVKNAVTYAGQLSLRETHYLLTRCSGILTNDSAPLHLGMAANINVFAFFGPTVPEFGFAPFGPKSKIFENRDLACRPCAIHGGKSCPIKTFECMESISPERIAFQVLENI
jgi:heptosyltransferase-2